MESVIIQFASFEMRDRWAKLLESCVSRVYKRQPWMAARISAETKSELTREPNVKIVQDIKLAPMQASGLRGFSIP